MTGRTVFTEDELIVIIAEKLGVEPSELSYMWQVEDDGTFRGIVVF